MTNNRWSSPFPARPVPASAAPAASKNMHRNRNLRSELLDHPTPAFCFPHVSWTAVAAKKHTCKQQMRRPDAAAAPHRRHQRPARRLPLRPAPPSAHKHKTCRRRQSSPRARAHAGFQVVLSPAVRRRRALRPRSLNVCLSPVTATGRPLTHVHSRPRRPGLAAGGSRRARAQTAAAGDGRLGGCDRPAFFLLESPQRRQGLAAGVDGRARPDGAFHACPAMTSASCAMLEKTRQAPASSSACPDPWGA